MQNGLSSSSSWANFIPAVIEANFVHSLVTCLADGYGKSICLVPQIWHPGRCLIVLSYIPPEFRMSLKRASEINISMGRGRPNFGTQPNGGLNL